MQFEARTSEKALATLLSGICLFFSPVGFTHDSGIFSHLSFCFFHANVFHFLANIVFLWMMKFPLRLVPAYAISFVCSYVPSPMLWGFCERPTCGLSGVLFASLGMAWGKYGSFGKMFKYTLLPVLLYGLIPNMNFLMHLYCTLLGYMYENSKSHLFQGHGQRPQ